MYSPTNRDCKLTWCKQDLILGINKIITNSKTNIYLKLLKQFIKIYNTWLKSTIKYIYERIIIWQKNNITYYKL